MTYEPLLSSRPQLLERDREFAEIDACIAAATAERGSFLVLEGRSGMGKSALLAELRRRAAAGFTTCSAVGCELEGEFAFGVVRQLFEPAIGSLSKVERATVLEGAAALAKPVLDVGGRHPAADQVAALHGLYWLAANLAARTPLLLAVDDAHWADAPSLRWLAYLLNRLEGLPVLVAIATRPPSSGPENEVLATILAHNRVRILALGPLREDSVAALVRTRLGAEPDPIFTAACLRATVGNPLGLNELLRDLSAAGVGPTSAVAADLEGRAPDAIARRVVRDLSVLGEEVERLAAALAVIGDGTDLRLVARLAGLEADRAGDAADKLTTADLIVSDRPPGYVHPLLRAAVYDNLSVGARQKLHRRAADILAAEGAEPEAVAAHLLRCEAGGSAETIEWLLRAAPPAMRRGAPQAAVSYLRRALAEGGDTARRAVVLAELGIDELVAGDPAAVAHLQEAVSAATDRQARARFLCALAQALVMRGDLRASRDPFGQALEEFRGRDEDAATSVECILMELTLPSLAAHYARLRELALGGTPSAELARVTLAYLLSWREGNRDEALSWIGSDFGSTLLFKGRDLIDSASLHWSIGALLGVDELDRAAGWCDTVMAEGPSNGHRYRALMATMVWKAYAERRMGLLAEAEADVAVGLDLSHQYIPFYVPLAEAYLAEILFERGRAREAYELIEGVSLDVDPGMEADIREIRGRLRVARGWQQPGVEDLRMSGRLCEINRLRNPIIWPWRASLAPALTRDCPAEARRLAEEDLANARRSGIPRAVGVALRNFARVDRENSVDLLRESAATLGASPAPLDLARSLADLGGTLRREGHRVDAREPLREALEVAARCGAVPLMERAQAELLAAGARPRRARLRGVEALTPSELRVARLAAEGRSNREIAQALFITVNTVTDHLGSTYGKLDITSREQLGKALDLADR